ncbi:MAG: phage terminase small subunit P27 family, partial [Oscillospiraceae bacterium]
KHLTKLEIENRKKTEIKAESDNVEAPSYLNKAQKTKFKKIADELLKINIISNLDCDCLARYIIAETMFLKMTKKLNNKEVQEDIFEIEKIANLQDKFFKQCRCIANDLGLTVTSRCKIVIPKIEEEKVENKFMKFGVARSG